MENISSKNSKLIENLKSSVSGKMENNEIIDVNPIYGIFLPKDNKFIFCKEDKFRPNEDFHLEEFFTNEYIESGEIRLGKIIYPWRKTGRQFSWHFNDIVFYVSFVDLLEKYSIDGVCRKKDIAYLYYNINEYLKENPKFIEQLLENEKQKIR